MKARDSRHVPGSRNAAAPAPATDAHAASADVDALRQELIQGEHIRYELRRHQELLQTIFDHIPVMISFRDQDGRVKLVNREWERTIGWTLDEILTGGVDVFAECYPDPALRQHARKFVASDEEHWGHFRTRVRDGRFIETSWTNVHLSDGTTIGFGQDVTEQSRAEEALRDSEERFRQLAENVREVFWMTTPDFAQTLYVSPAYESVWGRPRESRYREPLSFLDAVHPNDRARVAEAFARPPLQEFELEYRILDRHGRVRWIWDRGFPVRDPSGRIRRVAGFAEDITDRKETEERLRATGEQLRALSASVQSAREEERSRIAREIHDQLGSALTSLRWDLETLDKALGAGDGAERAAVRERITAMMRLTDTTLHTVRRIASELRPSILDDLGLMEAIEWQAQRFESKTGIPCDCRYGPEDLTLTSEQSTAVFRIFQEALTNVFRHAGARSVKITAEQRGAEFVLTIRDNGRGITEGEAAGPRSLGLVGMRERAHLIGGEVEIHGAPGAGTVVTVRVPLPQ